MTKFYDINILTVKWYYLIDIIIKINNKRDLSYKNDPNWQKCYDYTLI